MTDKTPLAVHRDILQKILKIDQLIGDLIYDYRHLYGGSYAEQPDSVKNLVRARECISATLIYAQKHLLDEYPDAQDVIDNL